MGEVDGEGTIFSFFLLLFVFFFVACCFLQAAEMVLKEPADAKDDEDEDEDEEVNLEVVMELRFRLDPGAATASAGRRLLHKEQRMFCGVFLYVHCVHAQVGTVSGDGG